MRSYSNIVSPVWQSSGRSSVQCLVCLATYFLLLGELLAGPRVDVVTGVNAPELEQFAAKELAEQFLKLFEADVRISDKVAADAERLILIGSPATNKTLQPLASSWPSLTDQACIST